MLLVSVVVWVGVTEVGATFINGDFETGDFTGWTVSAIDQLGDPMPKDEIGAYLDVVDVEANHLVQFSTGAFVESLFIATLQQSIIIPKWSVSQLMSRFPSS